MNHLTRFIVHPDRHRPRQNFFLPRHKRNRKISSSIQFPPRVTPVQNLSLTYLNALHNVEGDTWHRSLKKKEKKKHAGKIELSIQLRHRERREGKCAYRWRSQPPVGLEISRIDELDYTLYRAITGLKCGPTNKLHARLIPMTV